VVLKTPPLRSIVLTLCIVAVVAFVAVIFASGLGQASEVPLPSRESAIPTNAVKMSPASDQYPPILHSDNWELPVPLSLAINTAGGEDSPFILPDGNTLYFFFTPDVSKPAEQQLTDHVTGIYVSHFENGSWTNASRVLLQTAGKLALDGAAFVQGNTMWFASAREGYSGMNLFTAEYVGGKWSNWQYTGDKLNLEYQVGEMHITSDGKTMYFHSPRPGGMGGYDIWTTENVNGVWQPPQNVAAVNTDGNEGWPFITQDGNELWFTRTYLGTPAIYRSSKVNGSWSSPEMIVSQFAGEPSLDMQGNLYFVHHFFVNGTMIEADIYVAYHK
jgi:hypothetical protein